MNNICKGRVAMYISHIQKTTKKTQSVAKHSINTTKVAVGRCFIEELEVLAYLACILHDSGKNTPEFKEYILKASEDPNSVYRGEVVHSTAGGCLITKAVGEIAGTRGFIAELIREVIISHHGIYDCITPDGTISFERRAEKETDLISIEDAVYSYITEEELNEKIEQACRDLDVLVGRILSFVKRDTRYGSKHFYFGMIERMLLSLLIDADRTDTACFMDGKPLPEGIDNHNLQNMWQAFIDNLEERIKLFKTEIPIDACRQEISQSCYFAASMSSDMFRLVVPTGAGKTISSLRYALNHAKEYNKKHIIYVAPYNSILEQNAKVIRDIIGNDEAVLEHHCNIIIEEDGDNARYKELTSNWDSPVIATTAVQFLNTLFSDKTSSVRRMHTLANSVIIIDEVQFIPVKCISLFNLAMNFLFAICNASVILCSATQPLFDKLPANSLVSPKNMVVNAEKYTNLFKRTQVIDETNLIPGGFNISELADYVYEKIKSVQNTLVIVNTKSCARNLYTGLKNIIEELEDEEKPLIYHLSTDMCAIHRKKTLEVVMNHLNLKDKKVICVSTQLIEAGVDISFQAVIRSLAGLDNIIQAAGRCNRNNEYYPEIGEVFIVKIADENVSRLKDIKLAQDAMNSVLHIYNESPELIDNDLLSKKAMDQYYTQYFMNRKEEMDYNVPDYDTTIVDLLTQNKVGHSNLMRKNSGKKSSLIFKQAFKTAGENFHVIDEKGTTDIVVECDEKSRNLINEMNSEISIEQQLRALRQLQIYSVSISGQMKNKLSSLGALMQLKNGGVIALRKEFYSEETGVTEIPSKMNPYFS